MRQLAFAAMTLLFAATVGCRDRRTSEVGGLSDTAAGPGPAPEVPDTAPTARDFAFEQSQEFGQSIRQQLAQLDQEIEQLASQAKSRGGAVSDRALANIRASRRAVDRSLTRINAATAANWEQVKQGVNQSVENLNESIEIAQPK
jgi:small-conductance mechanosensitive channel